MSDPNVLLMTSAIMTLLTWLSRATGIGYRRRMVDYKVHREPIKQTNAEVDRRLRSLMGRRGRA